MLCVGKLRTNAEEEEREKTGQTGRQGFTSTWKRNELERKVSGILEKIGKEVGVNDIVSCVGLNEHKVLRAITTSGDRVPSSEAASSLPVDWWQPDQAYDVEY